MMTNDDERGGRGVKNAQNLMTSYVNDPLAVPYYHENLDSETFVILKLVCCD